MEQCLVFIWVVLGTCLSFSGTILLLHLLVEGHFLWGWVWTKFDEHEEIIIAIFFHHLWLVRVHYWLLFHIVIPIDYS